MRIWLLNEKSTRALIWMAPFAGGQDTPSLCDTAEAAQGKAGTAEKAQIFGSTTTGNLKLDTPTRVCCRLTQCCFCNGCAHWVSNTYVLSAGNCGKSESAQKTGCSARCHKGQRL